MGLFDGQVDPEQFNGGGGLLGRLLALQQFQGQYQPGTGFNDDASALQAPFRFTLSPRLSNDGQVAATGGSFSQNPEMQPFRYPAASQTAGSAAPPSGLPFSSPIQNTVLAQYSPGRPMGIPLPPVFFPGTPQNDAFVHSTIGAARAIGDAVGTLLNSDDASRPPAGSRPISATPWSGDHGAIKGAIGAGGADDVRISPEGEVWQQHPDGSWTNHGPADSYTGSGRPSGRRGKDRER
jgi:hypothetical protein